MKITVLKTQRYRNRNIYMRRLGKGVFEYIISHNGEVYTNPFYFRPNILRYLLPHKYTYSKKNLNKVYLVVMAAAEATVDELLAKRKK